ncbi:Endonuclease/exonuclease/phosphatase [Trema orientale]|uniref:Endonuclease/exonuclease/phosphatase n=1 Tax=Trema orientale TaxID=63057 RepID=A0A2P5DBL8_TREOI|nr:Endonuclease/exonuclease/phosphatase [Trema orientale]
MLEYSRNVEPQSVQQVIMTGSLSLSEIGEWNVSVVSFSKHHVDALITDGRGSTWYFTRVYGHPQRSKCIHTWELIRRLSTLSDLPWLLGGDLNEILCISEKEGGSSRCSSSMLNFWQLLDNCRLQDIRFSGPIFTWNNRVLLLRLEKILIKGRRKHHRKRPFRYKPWWQANAECADIVSAAWDFHTFRGTLESYEKELDRLLLLDEYYWKQRSQTEWLKGGDSNSKFFHMTASMRRSKNRIAGIKDNMGTWQDEEGTISSIIELYFEDIFATSAPSESTLAVVTNTVHTRLDELMNVADFLIPGQGHWNTPLLNDVVWPLDRDAILSILLGVQDNANKLIWHFKSSGKYSVRRCLDEEETVLNAIICCKVIRECWDASIFSEFLSEWKGTSFSYLFLDIYKSYDKAGLEIFYMIS